MIINKSLIAFYLTFVVFMQGCSAGSSELSEGGRSCYQAIRQSSNKLAEKYHLSSCGIGAGLGESVAGEADNKGIKILTAEFIKKGEATIKEARELILACADQFLKDMNANEELRPFLGVYPLTYQNIEIAIFNRLTSQDPNRSDPYLEVTSIHKGNIKYYMTNPQTPHSYESIIRETYEEATEIIQKEKTFQ